MTLSSAGGGINVLGSTSHVIRGILVCMVCKRDLAKRHCIPWISWISRIPTSRGFPGCMDVSQQTRPCATYPDGSGLPPLLPWHKEPPKRLCRPAGFPLDSGAAGGHSVAPHASCSAPPLWGARQVLPGHEGPGLHFFSSLIVND